MASSNGTRNCAHAESPTFATLKQLDFNYFLFFGPTDHAPVKTDRLTFEDFYLLKNYILADQYID